MSKAEGALIVRTHNAVTMLDTADKVAKPCPSEVPRRKLADISNLPQRPKPSIQDEKSQPFPTTTKEYIEQLLKENTVLKKILAHRNKIIEQSGIELDKLRINLYKMQEQNQQLALSNSQMLAELNSGKDRLKALQHEVGCKNGLLRALEHEERARRKTCKNDDAKFHEEACLKKAKDDAKPQNTMRTLRSNSLCSLEQVQSKEKAENRRPLVRRQSARLKSGELKPAEDSSERDDAEFPASHLADDGEAVRVNESIYEEHDSSRDVRDDDKLLSSKISSQLSDSGLSDHVQSKVKTENKRPLVRRQSARFKSAELKPAENSSERDAAAFPENHLNDDCESGHVEESTSVEEKSSREVGIKRSLPSSYVGPSDNSQSKEEKENKRPFTRRHSARFKDAELKPAEDSFSMNDDKSLTCPLPEDALLENLSDIGNASVRTQENSGSSCLNQEPQGRTSLCRPSRQAAKNVQSYKEIPLNIKMRRSE